MNLIALHFLCSSAFLYFVTIANYIEIKHTFWEPFIREKKTEKVWYFSKERGEGKIQPNYVFFNDAQKNENLFLANLKWFLGFYTMKGAPD